VADERRHLGPSLEQENDEVVHPGGQADLLIDQGKTTPSRVRMATTQSDWRIPNLILSARTMAWACL